MPQVLRKKRANQSGNKLRWRLILPIAAPPVLLIGLYYILRDHKAALDWVTETITNPLRRALGTAFSVFPFSVAEVLIAVFCLWALYHVVRTFCLLFRRKNRLRTLGNRLFAFVLVIAYVLTGYFWLWGINYLGSGFSDRSGLGTDGVTTAELAAVTTSFAEMASIRSVQVARDEGGHFQEDLSAVMDASASLYDTISDEFPFLAGTTSHPKKMAASQLMSILGFTGFYFPFTGETNINISAPACLIPATVAHEIAHQRGIASEEEANFTGIAACISSGNAVYEYSGYLSGLIYLMNALYRADPDAQREIAAGLSEEVIIDITDNSDYWAALSSPTGDAASAVYDTYLKANGQPLGIRSYGACVDLLVAYYS